MDKVGEYLKVINDNMVVVIMLLFMFGLFIMSIVYVIKFIIKLINKIFKKKPMIDYEHKLGGFKPKLRNPYSLS